MKLSFNNTDLRKLTMYKNNSDFFLLVLIFVFSFTSQASHFVGGEITWECISDPTSIDFGKFIFQLKAYGDCIGISFPGAGPGLFQTLTVHGHSTIPSIDVIWESTTDISPTGTPAAGTTCHDCVSSGGISNPFGLPNGFVIQEHTFRSLPISLGNGNIPDPTGAVWNILTDTYDVLPRGWHFTWGSSARNAATNMTSAGAWLLRAVMYPYNDPVVGILPAAPCYDSSPEFKELAKTIICTGYPFAYSHNASDEELDEITYSWAEPLGDNFSYNPANPSATALTFAPNPPYSVTTPIPGNPTLDPQTGEISYFSNSKVSAKEVGW